MDGTCWVCFCCWHSPIKDLNVRICWVHAMECMCVQTRPWLILSSERVFLGLIRKSFDLIWKSLTHVNSKEKIPSTRKSLLRVRGSNPWRCIKQDSEPSTLPTSYYGSASEVNLFLWLLDIPPAICYSGTDLLGQFYITLLDWDK